MDQPQLLRLQRIEVDGLFGRYNYCIDLNLKDRVTLLHGLNGAGKTTVLRMVDALLRKDFTCFRRTPFARFLLGFENGSSTLELQTSGGIKSNKGGEAGKLTLTRAEGASSTTIDLRPSEAESVAALSDCLQPHYRARNTWIDVRNGDVLSEAGVLSRFGTDRGEEWPTLGLGALSSSIGTAESPSSGESSWLLDSLRGNQNIISRPSEKPSWLDEFLESTNTFLIEAQRLVWTESSIRPKIGRERDAFAFLSSVLECSRNFQERLGDTMAAYGLHAQTLDQTFPQRLISATNQLAPDELRKRMAALNDKTRKLRDIGILDEAPGSRFDAASLDQEDSTQIRVMTLYVEDTERKLQTLEDLANRTRLLLDSVNGKFQNKRVRLDNKKKALVVEDQCDQRLPLYSLSSGEQHELVLHYNLLFRVRPNTVVLIDEPELSLHVAWQKKFLPDLTSIVELSDFDAVVATHSPFIVGDRDDLMVGLGD